MLVEGLREVAQTEKGTASVRRCFGVAAAEAGLLHTDLAAYHRSPAAAAAAVTAVHVLHAAAATGSDVPGEGCVVVAAAAQSWVQAGQSWAEDRKKEAAAAAAAVEVGRHAVAAATWVGHGQEVDRRPVRGSETKPTAGVRCCN